MKKLIFISFLLLVASFAYGQENKFEVTEIEFINNSTWIDTFERISFYPDSTIKKIELLSNVTSNLQGVERHHLYIHNEKKYKSNGQLKQTIMNEKETMTTHIYDHKGRDSWIYKLEYESPNNHILIVHNNGNVFGKMEILTEHFYYTGKLVHIKHFKKGKKHGRCEFYDDETGALKKIITYKEGKKVATEKFEILK